MGTATPFKAWYTDGRSAARHEVHVLPGRAALYIHDPAGDRLAEWPYRGLYLLEEVYGDRPARLGHREFGDATLTFQQAGALAALESVAGVRLRAAHWLHPSPRVALAAIVLLIVVGAGIVLLLPRLAGPLATLVPPAWEQALGQRVTAEMTAGYNRCAQPEGAAALERLVKRLTAQADVPYPFRVRVTRRPGVNAFTAPGGQIIVLRGLIDEAQTPEELAGVLAHEIAHGVKRHPMQGLLRTVGLQLLFSALLGDAGALDEAAARFGQLVLVLSYSRRDELAADRMGVELLNRAGIRGDGLVKFFERLEAGEPAGGGVPPFLSTHPVTSERVALIESMANGTGPAMSDQEWQALQGICGGK